jgi:signal transduction histidine kinase
MSMCVGHEGVSAHKPAALKAEQPPDGVACVSRHRYVHRVFTLFRELQRYVGFSEVDEQALRLIGPPLAPFFPAVAEIFYARVLEHEDARAALVRGEKQVGQLKGTLVRWMKELFDGPWDEQYVERRARIGRMHVQISLPQHFMVSAMNVVRIELRDRLSEVLASSTATERQAAQEALERICDLDLALMLHTYREDLEARQVRAERLATFGQLVGSIGHELRNPLGVIETSLYVLKGRPQVDERNTKHLDRISQQVTLANDIITQLLNLIRERPLARVKVDLTALISEVTLAVAPNANVKAAPGLMVDGDLVQLRQVLVNLAQNAAFFAGANGRVEIELHRNETGLTLTVDDSGPGIDPTIRNRLFEPLVTTRQGGIGLGLALVKRIVERHGGTVTASRGPLGGARFTVLLPDLGATS